MKRRWLLAAALSSLLVAGCEQVLTTYVDNQSSADVLVVIHDGLLVKTYRAPAHQGGNLGYQAMGPFHGTIDIDDLTCKVMQTLETPEHGVVVIQIDPKGLASVVAADDRVHTAVLEEQLEGCL